MEGGWWWAGWDWEEGYYLPGGGTFYGEVGDVERMVMLVSVARRTLYWERVRRWWSGERGKTMVRFGGMVEVVM